MKPTSIMIHHTAVSLAKNPDQATATDAYHRKKWNVRGSLGYYAGYHFEIAGNGQVLRFRQDGEKAVACYQKGMNDGRCLHICLDGDFDHDTPASEQIYALRDLLRTLCTTYRIPPKNIYFHRDYAKKSCPGANLDRDFVRSLIDEK